MQFCPGAWKVCEVSRNLYGQIFRKMSPGRWWPWDSFPTSLSTVVRALASKWKPPSQEEATLYSKSSPNPNDSIHAETTKLSLEIAKSRRPGSLCELCP
jgi:hypothetical protein